MSKFYTDVHTRFDKIYVRGYEDGKRVEFVQNYKPYLFLPEENGLYSTLDGKRAGKMKFDSISEARKFIKDYEQVDNFSYYGLTNWQYVFMYDYYQGEIKYDPSLISVVSLDIECEADKGFPDIEAAEQEITAITIHKNGKSAVFGIGEYTPTDENIKYFRCADEANLLDKFLKVWNHESFKPDVVTGWNIEFFDIPYLTNRIKRVLGEEAIKLLSPWKMVEEKYVDFRNKKIKTYDIIGISILDYYMLYRKFSFGNQESYKLDYIAQIELGEKKVDYKDQGYKDLTDLYKRNHQLYIEYNVQDTILVDKLEEKLKFIEQVMAIAYDAKVTYNDTMTTVRPWDVIIHNYLLDRRIVIPQFRPSRENHELVGGFIKDPKIGFSKWVVSFDLNSLYPHLIMQYNISPETFAGRIPFPSIDTLLEGNFKRDGSVAYAANGCTYRKDKQGFLPALMEKMYDDRVAYKKQMLEAKKKYEETKDPELIKEIARCHNMQLAKKIQLNSAYGALGNKYFRWFSFNNAEAITTSGQLSIRWIEKKINTFFNKLLKTVDKDYVIASDTDSIYVEMGPVVDKVLGNKSDEEITKALDAFVEAKIQPYIDSCYQELGDMMNVYQQKMQMKRETIANKGIWKAKKMYILNCWNVEGVQYSKPKLKIQGIEAVRSSTPHACREKLKESLDIIMNKDVKALIDYVENFREEFLKLSFEEVAFPRGMNNIDQYKSKSKNEIYVKGTPIHVKGALIYNNLVMQKPETAGKLPLIQDGDKIKFAWLKTPNPLHETVIAMPDVLPDQFMHLNKYIDRDIQFEKTFFEPLCAITDVINWNLRQTSTLEDFFGE
jgi:DNA polymerase elongation subunit (family B)